MENTTYNPDCPICLRGIAHSESEHEAGLRRSYGLENYQELPEEAYDADDFRDQYFDR